ncbi:MAG: hypothetical protein KDA24_03680 [Deltaproteobacteria bacterium]|nr:hypothetical protein [Deltaproteobacteria bacterium]
MHRIRLVLLLVLASTLALAGPALGKGKKKKKKGAEEPVTAPAPKKIKTELPGDATSKAFGENLIASKIVEFEPPDNDGATFIYETFTFKAGNTWEATAYLDVAGDRFDCAESGSWTIDAASSDTVGPVNWVVLETNCPGRNKDIKTRAEMTIESDGDVSYEFR